MATEHIPLPPEIVEILGRLHTEVSTRRNMIVDSTSRSALSRHDWNVMTLCDDVYGYVVKHILSHISPDETVSFSFPEDNLFGDHDFLTKQILLKYPTNEVHISHEKTDDGSFILFVTLH